MQPAVIESRLDILPGRSPWRGSLDITYALERGRTRPIDVVTQAPLRMQRAHYPEGEQHCYSTIVHTAGGMVGGDELQQRIQLQSGAQVLITTPAATKVYRSIGETARQVTHLTLAANAYLEWFPQETIVFNAAQYHQQLRLDLAPGAVALLWDITRFGRTARGEQFVSGDWRSDLEVWQEDVPLLIDRQWLPGDREMIQRPNALNSCPVVGTWVLVGQGVSDADLLVMQESLKQAEIPAAEIGLTQGLNGVICRYRGQSTAIARQAFMALWQAVRRSRNGAVPPLPRIWY
jgi:urease accessory protein